MLVGEWSAGDDRAVGPDSAPRIVYSSDGTWVMNMRITVGGAVYQSRTEGTWSINGRTYTQSTTYQSDSFLGKVGETWSNEIVELNNKVFTRKSPKDGSSMTLYRVGK